MLIIFQLTNAACKWLKTSKISDSDVARGKAILKGEVLNETDSGTALLESLQYQALLKGRISSPTSLIADIEKMSTSDVKSVCELTTFQFIDYSTFSVPFIFILCINHKYVVGCRQTRQWKVKHGCYW